MGYLKHSMWKTIRYILYMYVYTTSWVHPCFYCVQLMLGIADVITYQLRVIRVNVMLLVMVIIHVDEINTPSKNLNSWTD